MQILSASYPGAIGDYQSIATTTVGVGGVATVTLSAIPATYSHLQIRALTRTNRVAVNDGAYIYLNSDTTKTNYTLHGLQGDGATATSFGYASASATGAQTTSMLGNSSTAQMFSVMVMDILDYANTNKNKTIRIFGGNDTNGAGIIQLVSGAWLNSSAVNSIQFAPVNGTLFLQYSSFALYGIKG